MQITGKAYYDDGRVAAGVRLLLVHVGFGGASTTLATAETGADGSYTATIISTITPLNLQIRLTGQGVVPRHTATALVPPVPPPATDIALTKVRYSVPAGADDHAVINIVVPADHAPLGTEYTRLTGDLNPYVGTATLIRAREDGTTNDLTLLNRSSGWDARLIALAATAARLNRVT